MDMSKKNGLTQPCFEKMLDYTIDIFESNGLGTAYYGYHNIDHELEVTLGTLLVCGGEESITELSKDDLKYLYVSALFHDFDPEKSVDKPHEENVLKSISRDPTIKDLIIKAGIDFEIIKVLILRTVYPWEGDLRERAEKEIEKCFQISEITKDNPEKQKHYLWLGWLLSIIDRVTGYALGDFSKALHLAKMNSHASAWNPALMIKRSVMYFEGLIGGESNMCEMVLRCLPKHMRKNFMQNVQEFMKINSEIEIELIFDDKELDLSTRQADIGIWMRRPKQLNYIQKKLIDINYHIYGSAKYLEQYGHPKNLSDLNKHKFISYGRGAPSPVFNPDWALKLGVKDNKKRKPVMKVNSVYGLLLAVQSGVGLAALPDYITVSVPNIIRVLPQIEGPKTDVHFVYPQSLKNVARIVAFRNFLYSKVSKWEF